MPMSLAMPKAAESTCLENLHEMTSLTQNNGQFQGKTNFALWWGEYIKKTQRWCVRLPAELKRRHFTNYKYYICYYVFCMLLRAYTQYTTIQMFGDGNMFKFLKEVSQGCSYLIKTTILWNIITVREIIFYNILFKIWIGLSFFFCSCFFCSHF